MLKEFDIFLKRHVIECDLLVYSIPYRDGISVTDRLILDAALEAYSLYKFVAVQTGSVLTAHIDEMMKLCKERLSIGIEFGATAEIEVHNNLYLQSDPIILNTPAVETIELVMNEFQNGLILAAGDIDTQVALSAGKVNLAMLLNAEVTETRKTSLIRPDSRLLLNADIQEINQHNFIDADATLEIDATLQSLCYQLTIEASAAFELMAMVIGTEIRHSLGRWYNGLAIGAVVKGTAAQKFERAWAVIHLMESATGTLLKVLYPESYGMVLDVADANFGLKRYRLLSEVDDLTLGDIDDMTLGELDWVELT